VTDATGLLEGLDEGFVDHRGARIRVFAGGSGPPLLLIHGYGGAAWNFSELVPLLAGRTLIVPDLPGHAGSSALPAAPSLAAGVTPEAGGGVVGAGWAARRAAGFSCGTVIRTRAPSSNR